MSDFDYEDCSLPTTHKVFVEKLTARAARAEAEAAVLRDALMSVQDYARSSAPGWALSKSRAALASTPLAAAVEAVVEAAEQALEIDPYSHDLAGLRAAVDKLRVARGSSISRE